MSIPPVFREKWLTLVTVCFHPTLYLSRSLHCPLWHIALHSPVSIPFKWMILKNLPIVSPSPPPKNHNDGVLHSPPHLFILIVSTVVFVLGLIAFVLKTLLVFKNFAHELSSFNGSLWFTHCMNIVVALCDLNTDRSHYWEHRLISSVAGGYKWCFRKNSYKTCNKIRKIMKIIR